MYKRNAQGWSKHLDFIIVDVISQHLAYVLAYMFRHADLPYSRDMYGNFALVIALVDVLAVIFFNTMHNVLKRGYLKEFFETLKQCLIVFLVANVVMFATKHGSNYSRVVIYLTFCLHLFFGYITRLLWKKHILKKLAGGDISKNMMAVLEHDTAESIIERLNMGLGEFKVNSIIINGDTSDIKEIAGIPVVGDLSKASEYVMQNAVEAVYVDSDIRDKNVADFMDRCYQMAVPVHYHISELKKYGMNQFVEKIGGTTCVTTTLKYASSSQLAVKRLIDIVGGLVGAIFTVILVIILGPIIKIASPGPIFYSQERVGLNGKRFKIFKFRSMYMDADERKKELMEQNRVKDGMMFKMEFDPRVIGNKVLPDGTKKTGLGEFIRRTSLDEFPQFFNVLGGSMSLVGTRPPTVDEWEKYEYHHRARLSCKPGITGLWQISGRSEITDFEKVVELDTEYISNWSLGLDVKILFKTIGVVLGHKGAM